MSARNAPMWYHPAWTAGVDGSYSWNPPYVIDAAPVPDTGRHAKPEYDHGLDMIQGYLVAEGKHSEGKHRQRHHT